MSQSVDSPSDRAPIHAGLLTALILVPILLLISGGLIAVWLVSSYAFKPTPTPTGSIVAGPDGKEPEPHREPEALRDTLALGKMKVSVTDVRVSAVNRKSIFQTRETRSSEQYLRVGLKIENTSDTMIQQYTSWTTRGAFAYTAHLTDDFGNRHNPAPNNDVVGAVAHAHSLRPGTSVAELLLFDVPIEKATHLILTLAASNVGEQGEFRWKITREQWEPKK